MLGLPGLVAQHNRRGREPDPSKKNRRERERPEGQKRARPLFCSKIFTTAKKMLSWARMVFLG